MRQPRAMAFTELLVALVIVGAALTLAVPCLHARDEQTARSISNSRVNDVHIAMEFFAAGNRGAYPGVVNNRVVEASTEGRLQLLLDGGLIAPDTLISPAEAIQPWRQGVLTHDHYSFALLHITDRAPHRRDAWRRDGGRQTPVISDRGFLIDRRWHSVWGESVTKEWQGSVAWHDLHVTFETSPFLEETRYGSPPLEDDHLFIEEGLEDALVTFARDENDKERHIVGRGEKDAE